MPLTPAGRALGRKPAEGRRRARDRARSEGPDRGSADQRSRRRSNRISPPAASSPSATRGVRCCSSRSSSRRSCRSRTASSSSTRARSSVSIRATSRRRDRARDARCEGAACSVSAAANLPPETPEEAAVRRRPATRRDQAACGRNHRAGDHSRGRIPDRRPRRSCHRAQPAARVSRHLQRRRAELDLSPDDQHREHRCVQPLPDAAS